MRITCIDFETANNYTGSVCSVGIAVYEDLKLKGSKYWLVRPHIDHLYFNSFNTNIHGIAMEDVINAPEFDEVYRRMLPYIKDSLLVAHNAAFDMSVLRHVLDLYSIQYPKTDYLCSCKIAQKTWRGMENHKLNTICNHLNFKFKHHNAEEDAVFLLRR